MTPAIRCRPFGAHTVGVTHNDQMKMIPPLVLKPDPLQETPAVRTALHAIATDSRNAGRAARHEVEIPLRWYCYTDPTIGWARRKARMPAGPRVRVPRSVRRSSGCKAKAHGAHLETSQALVTPTDLEQSDIDQGAAVRPTTPDGLYNYSKQERADAANWLYDTIYNQAYEKAGCLANS